MIVQSFDLLDGKEIQVVFDSSTDLNRFRRFYKEAIELMNQLQEYDDPRGIEQGWVGKDGRP